MANAVVGAYLSQLGFSQSAVIYVTSAPPEGIQWLSELDAKKNGVEVSFIGKDEAKKSDIPNMLPTSLLPLKQKQGSDFVGFDLPGMPIKGISLSECDTKCQANSACKAFTYNLRHPACFLKQDVKIALRNAVAVSGFTSGIESKIVFSRIEVQSRTDFPGGDYRHDDNVSFADCVSVCENEEGCKSFSFIAKRKQCWLKTGVTSAIPKAGVVSGVKAER